MLYSRPKLCRVFKSSLALGSFRPAAPFSGAIGGVFKRCLRAMLLRSSASNPVAAKTCNWFRQYGVVGLSRLEVLPQRLVDRQRELPAIALFDTNLQPTASEI